MDADTKHAILKDLVWKPAPNEEIPRILDTLEARAAGVHCRAERLHGDLCSMLEQLHARIDAIVGEAPGHATGKALGENPSTIASGKIGDIARRIDAIDLLVIASETVLHNELARAIDRLRQIA